MSSPPRLKPNEYIRSSENCWLDSIKKNFLKNGFPPFSGKIRELLRGWTPHLLDHFRGDVAPPNEDRTTLASFPSLVLFFLLWFFSFFFKVWKLTTKGYYIIVFGLVVLSLTLFNANISDIHPLFYVNHMICYSQVRKSRCFCRNTFHWRDPPGCRRTPTQIDTFDLSFHYGSGESEWFQSVYQVDPFIWFDIGCYTSLILRCFCLTSICNSTFEVTLQPNPNPRVFAPPHQESSPSPPSKPEARAKPARNVSRNLKEEQQRQQEEIKRRAEELKRARRQNKTMEPKKTDKEMERGERIWGWKPWNLRDSQIQVQHLEVESPKLEKAEAEAKMPRQGQSHGRCQHLQM